MVACSKVRISSDGLLEEFIVLHELKQIVVKKQFDAKKINLKILDHSRILTHSLS